MKTHRLPLSLSLCACGLLAGLAAVAAAQSPAQQQQAQAKPPDPWPGAKMAWPKPSDWLEGAIKRLEKMREPRQGGGQARQEEDADRLLERAADVLDLARAVAKKGAGSTGAGVAGADGAAATAAGANTGDQFRYGRYIAAAGSLMDAADRVRWARRGEPKPEEFDFWGAGFILQGCYFRVRQANYFADMSGARKSEQYVELASSLYQQGRSAYDAKEYSRARLYGDASSSVVFALECLAQAATPDPHIYK
ncbi:MAG: hypothetical protein LBT74_02135 [Acidobacteriota bacterium]|jgi:hypothetical protein|nr:hypothetical protein [Acidobacteriota bacterium]